MRVILWLLVIGATLVVLWGAAVYLARRGPRSTRRFFQRTGYRRADEADEPVDEGNDSNG